MPDSFSEHVKLMFDLQALAFASDLTRVFAFKLGRDASNRTYPESGFNGAFHSTSHHGERENTIMEFARINHYHVSMVPYFLEKLKNTPDGDSNLLDNSLVIYGSPMGDSHVHNHKRCPLFLAGHAGGQLKGGLHVATADGTPMANAMLSVMHTLGFDDMTSFGDSTGALDLTSAGTTTAAGRAGVRPWHDARRLRSAPLDRARSSRRRWRCRRWPLRAMRRSPMRPSAATPSAVDGAAQAGRPTSTPPQGDGMTALHWAAMNGDAAAGRDAAARRRQPAARPRASARYTPLMLAAKQGHGAVVEALLDGRRRCRTPRPTTAPRALMFAAASGDVGLGGGAASRARRDLNARETDARADGGDVCRGGQSRGGDHGARPGTAPT